MGAIVFVAAIIGIAVLFVFLQFPPPYADKKTVRAFNTMVLVVCAMLSLVWILRIRTSLPGTEAEKFIKIASLGGAFGIESVFLTVCFILRNFWVFKPKRRSGDWF